MSRVVKVLHKSFLPGAGFTTGGVAKQGKTSIHGVIEVTNYARGGEALSPQDVGLTTLDHIDIKHREELRNSFLHPLHIVVHHEAFVARWQFLENSVNN